MHVGEYCCSCFVIIKKKRSYYLLKNSTTCKTKRLPYREIFFLICERCLTYLVSTMSVQNKKSKIKGEVITKYSAVLFNLFLSDKQKSSRHPLGIVLLQILGNYLSLCSVFLTAFLLAQAL